MKVKFVWLVLVLNLLGVMFCRVVGMSSVRAHALDATNWRIYLGTDDQGAPLSPEVWHGEFWLAWAQNLHVLEEAVGREQPVAAIKKDEALVDYLVRVTHQEESRMAAYLDSNLVVSNNGQKCDLVVEAPPQQSADEVLGSGKVRWLVSGKCPTALDNVVFRNTVLGDDQVEQHNLLVVYDGGQKVLSVALDQNQPEVKYNPGKVGASEVKVASERKEGFWIKIKAWWFELIHR